MIHRRACFQVDLEFRKPANKICRMIGSPISLVDSNDQIAHYIKMFEGL